MENNSTACNCTSTLSMREIVTTVPVSYLWQGADSVCFMESSMSVISVSQLIPNRWACSLRTCIWDVKTEQSAAATSRVDHCLAAV